MAVLRSEVDQRHIPEYLTRKMTQGTRRKHIIDVLKKVVPAIPQLRAADAAYILATTCPRRLARAYVPAIRAPVTAMEKGRVSRSGDIPRDKEDERA